MADGLTLTRTQKARVRRAAASGRRPAVRECPDCGVFLGAQQMAHHAAGHARARVTAALVPGVDAADVAAAREARRGFEARTGIPFAQAERLWGLQRGRCACCGAAFGRAVHAKGPKGRDALLCAPCATFVLTLRGNPAARAWLDRWMA